MPNWCSNTLTLKHEDPAMIARAVKAYKEGRLLDEFVPVPQDLQIIAGSVGDPVEQELLEAKSSANVKKHGYANWYDYCVNEWGTKWDIGDEHTIVHQDDHMASFNFDSAWSPPTVAYEKLQDQGFIVEAMYYEPGMCFCGVFDENGDDCYSFENMSSSDVAEAIPLELDQMFGISETMAEYEREEQDEVTTWYKDGVEETGLTPHKVKSE